MRRNLSIALALTAGSMAIAIGMVPVSAVGGGSGRLGQSGLRHEQRGGVHRGAGCVQGEASTFDLPAFMFVDFKGKVVQCAHRGRYEKSRIADSYF